MSLWCSAPPTFHTVDIAVVVILVLLYLHNLHSFTQSTTTLALPHGGSLALLALRPRTRGQRSCQGDWDSTVSSAAAAHVDTGLRQFLSVLLWLLVSECGEEAQCDRVPLLRQQQQQEAHADDAGCSQANHAEDHLMLQHVNRYTKECQKAEQWWGRAEGMERLRGSIYLFIFNSLVCFAFLDSLITEDNL